MFMWLAGMNEPDFRTISDFRKERLTDIKELFTQVLGVCRELGMVRCGKVSRDGTKIEANSGRHKVIYRKKLEKSKARYEETVEQILEEAARVDAEEDRLYGDKDGYSLEHPHSVQEIKQALKKLERQKGELAREMEKAQAKLSATEEKLERMGEDRNSIGRTDPDATLMVMKEGSLGVGYNVQFATEEQVIVGFGVYHRPKDNHLLRPMLEEVQRNLGRKPEVVVADKGYCRQDNYAYVMDSGIRAAIPPQTYASDRVARGKGTYHSSKNLVYETLKTAMMDFLETDEGRDLLKRRKHDVEPTFGDGKHNMGFRKLLLRGTGKATTGLGLVAIAHNIKKLRSWLGSPTKRVGWA
ncbi:MAG: transposase [Chloroflexi bacterium]|nr:transposase [Chloroflexota bacterium]